MTTEGIGIESRGNGRIAEKDGIGEMRLEIMFGLLREQGSEL